MATDHWGGAIPTPTLGGQRNAPLHRLPGGPERYAIRGPSDQRRLRAGANDGRLRADADGHRAGRRRIGREAGSRDDEPSNGGGGVG